MDSGKSGNCRQWIRDVCAELELFDRRIVAADGKPAKADHITTVENRTLQTDEKGAGRVVGNSGLCVQKCLCFAIDGR